MSPPDTAPFSFHVVRALLAVGLLLFIARTLFSLARTCVRTGRSLAGFFSAKAGPRRLAREDLLWPAEQPVAVMVAASGPPASLGRMLEHTVRALRYANYRIFVGVPQDAPGMMREVTRVGERLGRVRAVPLPLPERATLAERVNGIAGAVLALGEEGGERFSVFVLHDPRDIVHPLSLKVFNRLFPTADLARLPVFPLPPAEGVAWPACGCFMDDHAEDHAERGGMAGDRGGAARRAHGGYALSRRAVERLFEANGGGLFPAGTRGDGWDLETQIARLGLSAVFPAETFERTLCESGGSSGKPRTLRRRECVATWQIFPESLPAALRERTEALADRLTRREGSQGGRPGAERRHPLLWDRGGPVAILANGALALGLLGVFGLSFLAVLFPGAFAAAPLAEAGSPLWYLAVTGAVLMAWRVLERGTRVARVYGLAEGLCSAPRQAWGVFLNLCALAGVARVRFGGRGAGGAASRGWTGRAFPPDEVLASRRARLGEVFLENRRVTPEQVALALARQREEGRPLGAILVDMGAVSEGELLEALGAQLKIESREADPYAVPVAVLRAVPRPLAVRHSVFPVEIEPSGRVVVVTDRFMGREEFLVLEAALNRPVRLALATRGNVAFAIRRGYERLESAGSGERLGEILLRRGLVTEEHIREAIAEQGRAYRRLGDILVSAGLVLPRRLEAALDGYSPDAQGRLGDYLLREGVVTVSDLKRALDIQERCVPPIGEVLVTLGHVRREDVEAALEEQRRARLQSSM